MDRSQRLINFKKNSKKMLTFTQNQKATFEIFVTCKEEKVLEEFDTQGHDTGKKAE